MARTSDLTGKDCLAPMTGEKDQLFTIGEAHADQFVAFSRLMARIPEDRGIAELGELGFLDCAVTRGKENERPASSRLRAGTSAVRSRRPGT